MNTMNTRFMTYTPHNRKKVAGNPGFWNIVTIDQQNIRDRVALPKMVFMPISHSELLKVPSMDQNPGWDR